MITATIGGNLAGNKPGLLGGKLLRRQATTDRATPEGSSRVDRLDPFALPLCSQNGDHADDRQIGVLDLRRKHVVLRRVLRGMKIIVRLPISAYHGVAIRTKPATAQAPPTVAVVLAHPDPALSVTLCRAAEDQDIVAQWQSWGRALGMPLLVEESSGRMRVAYEGDCKIHCNGPMPRRRRRGSLHKRRASLPLRRTRRSISAPTVHRDEREIIARS